MNILIIGDSWGVPNYYGSPGVEPKYHTEFLLKELGYNVHNCSQNGSSNGYTIHRANEYFDGFPIKHPACQYPYNYDIQLQDTHIKIDWIIWFYTEWYRDFIDPTGYTYVEAEELTCRTYFKMFADLVNRLKCKTAIIGGQAVVNKMIYDYVKPDFIIEDWKSVLIGKHLPYQYLLHRGSEVISCLSDDTEAKLKLIENSNVVLHEMRQAVDLFPDRGHPGIKPHADLVKTLDNLFKSK